MHSSSLENSFVTVTPPFNDDTEVIKKNINGCLENRPNALPTMEWTMFQKNKAVVTITIYQIFKK